MYCSYFIIQEWSLMHQAAIWKKVKILDVMLKHGGDSNIQDSVSDYILFHIICLLYTCNIMALTYI